MEKPNAVLRRLDVLVGKWEMQASYRGQQLQGQAWTTFEWFAGHFLRQHSDVELGESAPADWQADAPFPVTTIMGLDDTAGEFTALYGDGRGVYRVYQMSFDDGVWKMWRNAPGFNQRFTGVLSDSGDAIDGRWEMSQDGTNWGPDLHVTYEKVS